MNNIAIKVENLSKAYQLGQIGTGTISRDLERWWAKLRGKEDPFLRIGQTNDRSAKGTSEVVWSLNDLNFEIQRGDAVGIIGRNGAGKSTLLKILSRVTAPTTGSIKVKGRIASLLEVGTGFHPELTGRENIFLNGAILGMRKAEIKRKFDEIVDFAGVERYIDTPVKRYSTGMYVRLAFAVAAHLESEILIVDEVLAVGDAEFQKKCLGKMGDVSKGEGRTVLFVSHNMGSMQALCNKGIVLNHGMIKHIGHIQYTVEEYSKTIREIGEAKYWNNDSEAPGSQITKLYGISSVNDKNKPKQTYSTAENIGIKLLYKVLKEGHILRHGINVFNEAGLNIFDSHSFTSKWYTTPHPTGEFEITAWIPAHLLAPGNYTIGAAIFNHDTHQVHFHNKELIAFNIYDHTHLDKSKGYKHMDAQGIIRPLLQWI